MSCRATMIGILLAALAHGCASTAATPTASPAACPACDCKCACTDGSAPTSPGSDAATREAVARLADAVSRKIAKRDGSCLADLDEMERLDRSTVRTADLFRPQCLMVSGKCSQGAELMRREWSQKAEMLREQVDHLVESQQVEYCTGPLDDRLGLLRALNTLNRGAHTGNIGIRACTDATKTVTRLATRVRPKDEDDFQVAQASLALGATAANCFARAGDCGTAWRVFLGNSMEQSWVTNIAARDRAKVIHENFESSVSRCKGRVSP